MTSTAFVLLLLPLATNALGFPSGGGGGCCCGGGAPAACAPLAPPCAPSCGSFGGGSNYYGGGSSGGYSQGGYAAASASYVQQPQTASYVSAPQQSGGYVQPQASVASSYSAPIPAPAYNSAPSGGGYANSGPASSYIPPVSAPQPSASSSSYGSVPPPPPPPPSNYAGSSTQYEQVNPSSIQKEGQYNEGTGAAAAGSRSQVVEDEEAAAGAELSAIAANATSNEPTPPIDISLLKLTNDTECNSEELREIIEQNTSDDLNTSKRLIQIASEAKFGGRFDVVCSQNDFSYLSNTELFCQHASSSQVSCYAYRQL